MYKASASSSRAQQSLPKANGTNSRNGSSSRSIQTSNSSRTRHSTSSTNSSSGSKSSSTRTRQVATSSAPPARSASKTPLHRPYLRDSTKAAIQNAAKRTTNNQFIDANTGLPIKGSFNNRTNTVNESKFHYGHTCGHEHKTLLKIAQKRNYTQEQFNDWINKHPDWFQIEAPKTNQSHQYEKGKAKAKC